MTTMGEDLRRLRETLNMTQLQFVAFVGAPLTQSQLSQAETNKRQLPVDLLIRIASLAGPAGADLLVNESLRSPLRATAAKILGLPSEDYLLTQQLVSHCLERLDAMLDMSREETPKSVENILTVHALASDMIMNLRRFDAVYGRLSSEEELPPTLAAVSS